MLQIKLFVNVLHAPHFHLHDLEALVVSEFRISEGLTRVGAPLHQLRADVEAVAVVAGPHGEAVEVGEHEE